jgi:hypothetical protein
MREGKKSRMPVAEATDLPDQIALEYFLRRSPMMPSAKIS